MNTTTKQTSPSHSPPPRLIYLFGMPGSGKSHVGRLLEMHYGYKYVDADAWLPKKMIETLEKGETFTNDMRGRIFKSLFWRFGFTIKYLFLSILHLYIHFLRGILFYSFFSHLLQNIIYLQMIIIS